MNWDEFVHRVGYTFTAIYARKPVAVPIWIPILLTVSLVISVLWILWWICPLFWIWAKATAKARAVQPVRIHSSPLEKPTQTLRSDVRFIFMPLVGLGVLLCGMDEYESWFARFSDWPAIHIMVISAFTVTAVWFAIKFFRYGWIRRKDIREYCRDHAYEYIGRAFDEAERFIIWLLGLRPAFNFRRIIRWIACSMLLTGLCQSLMAGNGYMHAYYLSTEAKDLYFTDLDLGRGLRLKVCSNTSTESVVVINPASRVQEYVKYDSGYILSLSWFIKYWPELAQSQTQAVAAKGWTIEQFKREYEVLMSTEAELYRVKSLSPAEMLTALEPLKDVASVTLNPQATRLTIRDAQGNWSEELSTYSRHRVLLKDKKVWLSRCSSNPKSPDERIFHWDIVRGVSSSVSLERYELFGGRIWSVEQLVSVFFLAALALTAPFCWLTYKGRPIPRSSSYELSLP